MSTTGDLVFEILSIFCRICVESVSNLRRKFNHDENLFDASLTRFDAKLAQLMQFDIDSTQISAAKCRLDIDSIKGSHVDENKVPLDSV